MEDTRVQEIENMQARQHICSPLGTKMTTVIICSDDKHLLGPRRTRVDQSANLWRAGLVFERAAAGELKWS